MAKLLMSGSGFFLIFDYFLYSPPPTHNPRQGLYSSGWPGTFCIAKEDLLGLWVSATTPSVHLFLLSLVWGTATAHWAIILVYLPGIGRFLLMLAVFILSCTQQSLSFLPHTSCSLHWSGLLYFSQSTTHPFYWSCQRMVIGFINEVQLFLFLFG